MKIAYIASYFPRECGIATFTEHLIRAISNEQDPTAPEVSVIAMNDEGQTYEYPPEVTFTIRQQHMQDYLAAADHVNESGVDFVVVQHEFGIFGGEAGVYLLPFLHRLKVPYMVTFHTVLKESSFMQRMVVKEIAQHAAKVIVMSNLAINFRVSSLKLPRGKKILHNFGVRGIHQFHSL